MVLNVVKSITLVGLPPTMFPPAKIALVVDPQAANPVDARVKVPKLVLFPVVAIFT